MIDETLERWHRWVRAEGPEGLEELLADDVVFHSPIVFTPQVGRDLTAAYLTAAKEMFGAGSDAGAGGDEGGFRYVTEVRGPHQAVLEFEATVDGVWVDGVDIITCDEEGLITEFKVMVRPLRAVEAVHGRMRAILESMGPPS